jgi:hypothetical protein
LLDTTRRTGSPLVIGVSGHRDLHPEAEARVSHQIGAFLRDLERRMPDTELRIMVGMAQGADLLVARAALAAGWQVDAVLPMPLEQYVEDFDAVSSAALRALLQDPSVHCTVLPPPAAASPPHQNGRDALYANLTEVLIDKCNVLLALWNGEPSVLPGGTADTVMRYLGARTVHSTEEPRIEFVTVVTEPTWGPHFVYWIPTMRSDDAAMPSQAPCYLSGIGENLLAVHRTMPHLLEHQLTELNAYNREFERLRKRKALRPLDSLLPTLEALDTHADRESLRRIDLEYGKADALAIYYQSHSDRLFRWFSFLASCMALMFLIYAKLAGSSVLLELYLAILAVSLIAFYFIRRQQWFSKHLVYRVIAETMRTKFFLRAAGADRLVNATELINLTGIDQFAGFSWIGNLLKNIEPLDARRAAASDDRARLQSVHRHWIRGQQEYFNSRVHKLEREHRRLEKMKSVMFYAIAILALALLLFADRLHSRVAGTITAKDVVIFFMGLLPVWMGIWELYQNKMAMRELLWQYRNQLGHFTRAELQLSHSPAGHRQQEILAQVGKESLMESYLWTIHRYHREYEPPSVG